MKKLSFVALIAAASMFVACGPSAEEKAAKEKAQQDSVAAAEAALEQARLDSIASAEAAKEQARLDSLKQDSIMKAEKKGKKK